MSEQVYRKKTVFKGVKDNPSLLGFGCMRFPTLEEGKPDIDETLSAAMIDYAYQKGVNYFDTAYPYHQGMSETFIGKALKKYPRESFYLATKMPSWLIESVDDVKRIFEEQLKKCQVDYFDYYLCHALNKKLFENYRLPGVMDYLYELKKQGKIRYLGFSFHDTPDVLEEIIDAYSWDFVQLQVNYLDWTFQDAKRQYEIVEKYQVPCIVMEPVRGGTLATLCEESRAVLKEANPEKSIASWAIRYVASLDNVMVILSGMSNHEQTDDNIGTLTHFEPLNPKERKVLKNALDIFMSKHIIPCTSCHYCMPCAFGVDIPLMFEHYNDYALNKQATWYRQRIEKTAESKHAKQCTACGACLPLCPQSIDIPTQMTMIREKIETLLKEKS